jgi:hypothetical protein
MSLQTCSRHGTFEGFDTCPQCQADRRLGHPSSGDKVGVSREWLERIANTPISSRRATEDLARLQIDAIALLSSAPSESGTHLTVPREVLSDLIAYGLIRPIENVVYGNGRSHRERLEEAEAILRSSYVGR